MSNQPSATIFFYPDPFGDGQAVTIEANDREDADKQLKKLQEKRDNDRKPTDTPQPTAEDSAPAPEADESSRERTS